MPPHTENHAPPDHMSTENDLLSELLTSVRVSHSGIGYYDLKSPWTVKLQYVRPICSIVLEGQIWLFGPNQVVQKFEKGDTFLLPHKFDDNAYLISSSPNQPGPHITSIDLHKEFAPLLSGKPEFNLMEVKFGEDGETTRIASFGFEWEDAVYSPLLDALPPFVRIAANDISLSLFEQLNRFILSGARPGSPGFKALMSQSAQLFLMHAMQRIALETSDRQVSWLRGLQDHKLMRVLTELHRSPGEKWTVLQMSKVAGMSRTSFATRFVEVMEQTPMDYLSRWRMHLARLRLINSDESIISIAQDLGYQSEAAFRKVFHKVTGQSPRKYGKSASKL